jgi:hydroxymethylbilane synthase
MVKKMLKEMSTKNISNRNIMDKLIIATRGSQLALWQSEHIKSELLKHFPHMQIELEVMKTKGDKILDTPLALIGGKGLFTKELEVAMLEGRAHLAVHSLKDVPTRFEEGLMLSAVTKRADPRDAMLSEKYNDLKELPKGAVVGTTSLRRRMQLLKIRPDLTIKDLRGNINTRIQKLKDGEFDAIILAIAGINRLGLDGIVKYITPIGTDVMIPAMGQAVLGIETTENEEVIKIVSVLNDEAAMIESTIERDFIDTLEGGCQVPIGIKADIVGDDVVVKTMLGLPNGKEVIEDQVSAPKSDYQTIGKMLAQRVIEKGARELLARAEEIAFK